jgi:hypothetical protein
MNDPWRFPVDYDEFCQITEREERSSVRSGGFVCRVDLDPEKLLAWCEARSLKMNRMARIWSRPVKKFQPIFLIGKIGEMAQKAVLSKLMTQR